MTVKFKCKEGGGAGCVCWGNWLLWYAGGRGHIPFTPTEITMSYSANKYNTIFHFSQVPSFKFESPLDQVCSYSYGLEE